MSIIIKPMTPEDLDEMNEEHNRLNQRKLPIREDIPESLERYYCSGIMPGDFLTAVLENDLRGAVARADSYNKATLVEIVEWCFANLPSHCWGSRDKVDAYLKSRLEQP